MLTVVLLAAALLADAPAAAAPAPAAALTPGAAAAPDKAAAKLDDDPMICRTEATVGSRLPVRTCRHKSTWDIYTRRSREAAEEVQNRSHGPFFDRDH